MKRHIAVLGAAAAVVGGALAASPPQAHAASLVVYANCVGVAPGISNLLSTPGNAYRINNHAATRLPTPPNRPLKIRNLLASGGVVGETGGVNNVQVNFSSPYPYSKSQCWVPLTSTGDGGVLYCDTFTQ